MTGSPCVATAMRCSSGLKKIPAELADSQLAIEVAIGLGDHVAAEPISNHAVCETVTAPPQPHREDDDDRHDSQSCWTTRIPMGDAVLNRLGCIQKLRN